MLILIGGASISSPLLATSFSICRVLPIAIRTEEEELKTWKGHDATHIQVHSYYMREVDTRCVVTSTNTVTVIKEDIRKIDFEFPPFVRRNLCEKEKEAIHNMVGLSNQ